jgi:hypothetical protein
MAPDSIIRTGRWVAGGGALAAACYLAYVAYAWMRYGAVEPSIRPDEHDPLLDRYMPVYEVAERHQIRVKAPSAVTFQTATEMDLEKSPIVRMIFKGREWIMGSRPAPEAATDALITQMRAIGWGVLAEVPGREIVMGAVTQPWKADVVFRSLPPEDFAAFQDPDYVKIVWTLRADPIGPSDSVFRTETRAVATDPTARRKFRRYWSFLSPGIIVIRWAMLGPLKADAERRARKQRAEMVEQAS